MNAAADIRLDCLPPKLVEIAQYCGEEVARGLLMHFGGGHLFVPSKLPDGHQLACVLGYSSANKLVEMYGGETFQVPRAATALREFRNQAIRELYAGGHTQFQLARLYGLTERHINTIVSPRRVGPRQDDLFGG